MRPREIEAIAFFDVEDAGLPPRSRLYNLPPNGMGTERVEGLVSYVVRLARAHSVNPRRLVEIELGNANLAIAKFATAFFRKDGGTVNGLGQYAELFAAVLAELTSRQDLCDLTLLPWKEVFPRNGQGLLARHPKWCPVCLDQQRRSGEGMAFPLAWSMELYSVCAAHRVDMENGCPSCGKTQPFFPRYPDLTICHHCRYPLADGRVHENHSHFELWVAGAIGDMVRRQSEPGFEPSLRRFQEFVLAQVNAATGGNRAAFCRALGFDPHGVRGWLDRNERPSFTQFLTLCYGVDVMPAAIFSDGPTQGTIVQPRRHNGPGKERRACPRPTSERREQLEQALRIALSSGQFPSVSSIADELGIGPSGLRYWFPDLCGTLSERHRLAVTRRTLENEARQCARIEEVVRKIQAEGGWPSRRKVTQLLRPERISLIRPQLSRAYQEAVRS